MLQQLQRLSKTSRPEEVEIWMKTRKRSPDKVPVVLDASSYGSKWVQWWTESQPQARDVRAWPFPKEPIDDTSWWKFPAHGRNGLFLAVMAISWWAPAVKLASDIAYFEEAVDDLHWVIRELIRTRSSDDPPAQCLSPLQPQHVCQDPSPSPQRVDLPLSGPPPTSSHPPSSSLLASSFLTPSSSHPTPLASGPHTWQRAEGKRVVKPSRKARER
jgi:hypothetical protein